MIKYHKSEAFHQQYILDINHQAVKSRKTHWDIDVYKFVSMKLKHSRIITVMITKP